MADDMEETNVLTDLRRRFPVARGYNSWQITSSLLRDFPPRTEGAIPGELPTNGLDCLMQLVRHIHSRYSRTGRENELEIFLDERRNPLLELAWSSFDLAGGDHQENHMALLAKEKQKVLQALISKGTLDRNELEGINLINSMLMNLSIWSRPGFRVFEKILVQEPDSSTWQVIYRQGRDRDGLLGNIDYNASDYPRHWKLQDIIDNHFGELVAEDCNTEVRIAYPSAVVRIEYEPSSDSPGNFQDLKRFTVPLYSELTFPGVHIYIYFRIPRISSIMTGVLRVLPLGSISWFTSQSSDHRRWLFCQKFDPTSMKMNKDFCASRLPKAFLRASKMGFIDCRGQGVLAIGEADMDKDDTWMGEPR